MWSFDSFKLQTFSLRTRILRIQSPNLNNGDDVDELENLVDNLKQQFVRQYKSSSVFTD